MQQTIDLDSQFSYHSLQLSSDVYNLISQQTESFVFSPLSIYEAMYLLLVGAKDQTAKELSRLLKTNPCSEDIRTMIRLKKNFGDNNTIINKIYIRNGAPVKMSYVNALAPICNTKKAIFDDTFVSTVNTDVKNLTHGLIPKILDNINKDMVMLILNVIYFKGMWQKTFSESESTPDTFYSSPPRSVTYMKQESSFMYSEDADYQLIEKPYRDNIFTMGFFLPKDSAATMDNFDTQRINYLMSHLSSRIVNMSIPKFKQQYHNDINDIIKQLGVKTIFCTSANFEHIFAPTKHTNYFVSKIIHEAVINVDEKGTEAAAMTAIIAVDSAFSRDRPIIFNANHPFAYYIRHIPSNIIVFLGKYA
jgi:serine protease inhibitor